MKPEKSTIVAQSRKRTRWLGAAIMALAMVMAPLAGGNLVVTTAEARDAIFISGNGGTHEISVDRGKPVALELGSPIAEVVVGDESIADVDVISDRTIVVRGKEIGTSGIAVFDANRTLVANVDVEVTFDAGRLTRTIRSRVPDADIAVSSANGKIVLSGEADDAVAVARATEIAEQFSDTVINDVGITTSQQVQLEVRFLEASREAEKELGVQWSALKGNQGVNVGQTALLSNVQPFGVAFGRLLSHGVQVDGLIRALEQSGTARRLAEPNLVTMSGDTANFLAGGEFPVPVPTDETRVTIEYKKFGVGLEFTPTVLDDRKIHLVVEPEVSQIDNTLTVQLGDFVVPSLSVRRAKTTVELRDGQSFVIAGLLQSIGEVNYNGLPWLKDVPVLGTLFRSSAFKRKETDLIIVVTPRLVEPLTPEQKIATPFDKLHQGNDADVFLNGRPEVVRARPAATIETDAGETLPTGHILNRIAARDVERVQTVDTRRRNRIFASSGKVDMRRFDRKSQLR